MEHERSRSYARRNEEMLRGANVAIERDAEADGEARDRRVKLATFIPPGADAPVGGEVRGEEAVAFGDGATVLDRLANGERAPASGE